MSFTRFHDDPCRIAKQLEESSNVGKYRLNVPGNGLTPLYMEDPYIRLQKWGANLRNNTIEMESDFRNMNNRLSRNMKNYKDIEAVTSEISYPSEAAYVDDSRASVPAWIFRDMETLRWEYPLEDKQKHVEIPFSFNEHTRMSLKDNFVRKL